MKLTVTQKDIYVRLDLLKRAIDKICQCKNAEESIGYLGFAINLLTMIADDSIKLNQKKGDQ